MRKILLLFALSFCIMSAFAQYQTYKNNYNLKTYEFASEDKFNPTVAGLCAIFPGAGHFYAMQPGRGLLFMGGMAISGYAIIYGSLDEWAGGWGDGGNSGRIIMYAGLASFIGIYIWNVFDAVKVSKIKNMHFRETGVALSVRPQLISQQKKRVLALTLDFRF